MRGDTASLADIDRLAARTKDEFEALDLLFVNAGVTRFVAVEDMTETVHDEVFAINAKGPYFTVRPRGIRVNALSPGPIDTGILERSLPEPTAAALREQMTQNNPMKPFGTVTEIAEAVAFLGFDATFTTGAELTVDGGTSQL
jgi:NAD(P)-dependent dehydrogenase (short-subunit alcohol dehydrogenase family)